MDSGQRTWQAAEPIAIATTALTRHFGDMTAVDHIDLRIPYGQIFGLLGPSGAEPVEPPAASAEPSAFLAFFRETAAIAQVELRKLFRDPTELFSRAVQPLLWLVIFILDTSDKRQLQGGPSRESED